MAATDAEGGGPVERGKKADPTLADDRVIAEVRRHSGGGRP